jgi:hypothetical protein
VGSGGLNGGHTRTRAHVIYLGSPPPEGKDLCPACLTLYYGGVHSEVLQWWHICDLARGEGTRDYEHLVEV